MKIIRPKLSDEIEILPFRIDNDNVYVKFYEGGVQAGFPSPADDFKEQKLSLDRKYLDNPDATFLIIVKGNSMLPTLCPKDILIVKSDIEFNDNAVGIVSVNNTEFTVKRLNKKSETLIADNPNHKDIKVGENDVVVCLGVVKHLIRDL